MLFQKDYVQFDLQANGGFPEKMRLMEESGVNRISLPLNKNQADNLDFFKKVDSGFQRQIETASRPKRLEELRHHKVVPVHDERLSSAGVDFDLNELNIEGILEQLDPDKGGGLDPAKVVRGSEGGPERHDSLPSSEATPPPGKESPRVGSPAPSKKAEAGSRLSINLGGPPRKPRPGSLSFSGHQVR